MPFRGNLHFAPRIILPPAKSEIGSISKPPETPQERSALEGNFYRPVYTPVFIPHVGRGRRRLGFFRRFAFFVSQFFRVTTPGRHGYRLIFWPLAES